MAWATVLLLFPTLAVGITFDAQTYTYQCDAVFPNITWNGYHNVVETETSACDSDALSQWFSYYSSGHTESFPISAKPTPGSCRYFKCSLHCTPTTARFAVCCDPSPSPLSPPPILSSPSPVPAPLSFLPPPPSPPLSPLPPPPSPPPSPLSTTSRTVVVISISIGTLLVACVCCWVSMRR